MYQGEDNLAIDMILALKLYRRTRQQSARTAQAVAIATMAKDLQDWAAKEPEPVRPWGGNPTKPPGFLTKES